MTDVDNFDIDFLMSNPEAFSSFIYTPINDAIKSLEQRSVNLALNKFIDSKIPIKPTLINNTDKLAFLSRDLATSNFETKKFIEVVEKEGLLKPVFWEYYGDRFSPNVNITKYSLVKMTFYFGLDKSGKDRVRNMTIVDFNLYNGKKISEVKTLWGQSLVEFHHELLDYMYPNQIGKNIFFFDATEWYRTVGDHVSVYYENLLILYLRNGILFEEYFLDDQYESVFIKNIFLPAFIKIYKESGFKPLICNLSCGNKNSNNFGMYYPDNVYEFVKNKINLL
jgi:hypothetical protein